MKKLRSILIFSLFALLAFPSSAKADIEFFQAVMGKVKVVISEATNVIRDIQEQVRYLTQEVSGVAGEFNKVKKQYKSAVKQYNDAKQFVDDTAGKVGDITSQVSGGVSGITGAIGSGNLSAFKSAAAKLQVLPSVISEEIKDTGGKFNELKVAEVVAEKYIPKYGDSEDGDITTSKMKEEQDRIIQRKNISQMYATAFTFRTNLKQEREELEETAQAVADSGDKTDARVQMQEIAAIENRMAVRFAKILKLDADYQEFSATQRSRGFKSFGEEGEAEK